MGARGWWGDNRIMLMRVRISSQTWGTLVCKEGHFKMKVRKTQKSINVNIRESMIREREKGSNR